MKLELLKLNDYIRLDPYCGSPHYFRILSNDILNKKLTIQQIKYNTQFLIKKKEIKDYDSFEQDRIEVTYIGTCKPILFGIGYIFKDAKQQSNDELINIEMKNKIKKLSIGQLEELLKQTDLLKYEIEKELYTRV